MPPHALAMPTPILVAGHICLDIIPEIGSARTLLSRYVYLYVEGDPTEMPRCKPPDGKEQYYTVWKEVILNPGDQVTILANTLHWFQAGPQGAIVSEFSTTSYDEFDIFTDHEIKRMDL